MDKVVLLNQSCQFCTSCRLMNAAGTAVAAD